MCEATLDGGDPAEDSTSTYRVHELPVTKGSATNITCCLNRAYIYENFTRLSRRNRARKKLADTPVRYKASVALTTQARDPGKKNPFSQLQREGNGEVRSAANRAFRSERSFGCHSQGTLGVDARFSAPGRVTVPAIERSIPMCVGWQTEL